MKQLDDWLGNPAGRLGIVPNEPAAKDQFVRWFKIGVVADLVCSHPVLALPLLPALGRWLNRGLSPR